MNTTAAEPVIQLRSTIFEMGENDADGSLMGLVMTTIAVLMLMVLISCLCCLCMKLSDLRLRAYVTEKARKKGLNVDLNQIDSKSICSSPNSKENCTIMVPDVGYIL